MSGTVIFSAKKIITMSESRPEATHVAVRDGRVLGVGSLRELSVWGAYSLDDRFKDKIILPGFVEGHSHTMEGDLWEYPHVGYFDRRDPQGFVWQGLKSHDGVIERLIHYRQRDIHSHALIAWGYDPLYYAGKPIDRNDLDKVSTTSPIIVMHASGHSISVNSYILEEAGVTQKTLSEGIIKDANGQPTGELRGQAAMFMAFEVADAYMFDGNLSAAGLWNFAHIARISGTTTVTELGHCLNDDSVAALKKVTKNKDFPVRIVPAYMPSAAKKDGVNFVRSLEHNNHEKLHFGPVKILCDGAIQGYSAKLQWPGYLNGEPNGIFYHANLEQLKHWLSEFHRAGLQVHIHANGDQAIEMMLEALEQVLEKYPRRDHRHTLQHCQMITEAQLKRAAALGVCLNMFVNHIYFWGEQHLKYTIGPDRAHRLNPVASAKRLGLNYSVHSDAPVTPLAPMVTAWCAVNRLTSKGNVLGEHEKISVHDALKAITLGAAYTLKLDHLVGSIDVGKYADFAVLDADPYAVDPAALKDISVAATVVGGKVFE